jgi:molybdate transport system permease protein
VNDVLELSGEEWTAVRLSLRIALWATVVSLPFGVAVAYVLARKAFWGKALVDGMVHLPLVLPPVVTGYLLLVLFGHRGPLGEFFADHLGIVFSFRWTGAALASGVMAFPLLVRAIRLSLEAIDRRLEDASATLGANRFWSFATVTLPLALPGIIAGMVLAFARALGEFGATITFVSNIPGETQTVYDNQTITTAKVCRSLYLPPLFLNGYSRLLQTSAHRFIASVAMRFRLAAAVYLSTSLSEACPVIAEI